MIYFSNKPFDGPDDDASCRCLDLAITVGGVDFKIRNSIDKPAEFTVISPKAVGKSPQARQLVDYLVLVLGGERMFFYDRRSEKYREVDLLTLEFKADENVAVQDRGRTSRRMTPAMDTGLAKNHWAVAGLVEPCGESI